jgi:hypothetical protein
MTGITINRVLKTLGFLVIFVIFATAEYYRTSSEKVATIVTRRGN